MVAAVTARGPAQSDPFRVAVIVTLWLLLGLFVLYPLACLLVRAFSDDGGFTLAPIVGALGNPTHLRALRNSLVLATLVGMLGTAAGFLFAYTVERTDMSRGAKRLIDLIVLLPLISPPFTTSIGFVFSFGPRGLITHDLLGMQNAQVYGWASTTCAEALTYFPLAFLALRPLIAAIGGDLEEAAFSLGGSRWQVFRTVTLPLTTPGLGNAFLLIFAASLADFATPLILAGNNLPVLPTDAYLQITGMFDLKGGAVLSLLLLVPAGLVFFAQRYLVERRSYVTITGKIGGRAHRAGGAPGVGWVLGAGRGALALFILYLYALLVYASAVVAFGANGTPTLDNYRVIFTEGIPAIQDTLIVALIGMPLGGLYGGIVGHLIARSRGISRHMIEIVSMINYALPGTIVGIAYLIAFNDPPFVLTGTALIIIACYIFRYGPTGIRATVALLQQIDPSLEEASQGLGARSGATFRRITLPLIMPAFFAGLGIVFVRSMTAISATIFLVSIGWTLITVKILENITELSLGSAAAFSVLVVVIVFAVIAAISWALRAFRAPGAAMTSLLGG